jgi:xylulokinase
MRFIGIDTGTSALKGALVNLAGLLEVVHRVERPYLQNGNALRNPELWARLATDVINELSGGGRLAAIGFTGQMHSLIAVDERDRVLDPVMLWLDMHGATDLDAFVTENRLDLVQKTGNAPLPDFTLAKWQGLRPLASGSIFVAFS